MKHRRFTIKFWVALAIVNVLAILYPIGNFIHCDCRDARFFAELALVGVFFVMGMLDTLAIVIATI